MPRFVAQVGLHSLTGNRENFAIAAILQLDLIRQRQRSELKGTKAFTKGNLFGFGERLIWEHDKAILQEGPIDCLEVLLVELT